MRIAIGLGALSVLISGNTPPAPFSPNDPVREHYPSAAYQAGVNGEAVLRCERTEHGRFANCEVVSESPKGRGFGAAALDVASHAAVCEALALPASERRAHEFTFGFRATATLPVIWPEVLSAAHSATYLIRTPSRADIAEFYPPKAKKAGVSGRGVMLCSANPQGDIVACTLEDEEPKGYGFGDAVMRMGYLFKVAPQPKSQCPYAPMEVVIPVDWRLR